MCKSKTFRRFLTFGKEAQSLIFQQTKSAFLQFQISLQSTRLFLLCFATKAFIGIIFCTLLLSGKNLKLGVLKVTGQAKKYAAGFQIHLSKAFQSCR